VNKKDRGFLIFMIGVIIGGILGLVVYYLWVFDFVQNLLEKGN